MGDRPIIFSAPMVRALLDGRKTQTRRVLKPQPPRGDHFGRDIMDWGLSGIYRDDLNTSPSRWWLDVQTDVDDNSHREIDIRYGAGDRLWVRENWQTGSGFSGPQIAYKATGDTHAIDAWDGEDEGAGPSFNYDRCPSAKWHTWLPDLLSGAEGSWRPSIHMPRWASRLTLAVTDVRVERLRDISEADAVAEGATCRPRCSGFQSRYDGWSMDWSRAGQPSRWGSENGILTEADISLNSAVCAFASFINERHDPLWNHKGDGVFGANPWVAAISFTVHRANIDALSTSEAAA